MCPADPRLVWLSGRVALGRGGGRWIQHPPDLVETAPWRFRRHCVFASQRFFMVTEGREKVVNLGEPCPGQGGLGVGGGGKVHKVSVWPGNS